MSAEVTNSAPKKGGALRSVLEFVIVIVVALVLAFLITNFVCKPYQIPSESMVSTIEVGDRVLSEKVSYYTGSPKQGQIVTFENVEGKTDENGKTMILIKRVIAVAGQTVDLKDGVVYVDGEALDEPYTNGLPSYPLDNPDNEITYPYTVPEGCIWCMGDNRTNSEDSRWFGAVPVKNVTGHAFFTYWPLNRFGFLS